MEKKFFSKGLTDRQREAIDIALNTPDIALIQGPPGTGKTTVICAILERLNEISSKTGSMKGRYLVTSSQHVAIENLISRLSVNSMPAIKGDKRASGDDDDDDADSSEAKIDEWVRDMCQKVKDKNPSLKEDITVEHFRNCVSHYMANPTSSNKSSVLESILSMPLKMAKKECVNKAREMLLAEKEAGDDEKSNGELVRLARALRTTVKGASDDGQQTALALSVALEDANLASWLSKEDIDALNIAIAGGDKAITPAALKALGRVKQNVLKRAIPRPVWHTDKISQDVLDLIEDVEGGIKDSRGTGGTLNDVLMMFYSELKDDGEGLRKSIKQYSPVYSLTVQHAGSERYTKELRSGNESVSYDTVIVDESARVSPFDLLIPLSQARRRIILVGDHRQLPQMVEKEVIDNVLESEQSLDAKALEKVYQESLFEHLFTKRLKELYLKDGIKRCVTLDAQYRMHPLLGDFVSEHFYKEDGGFRSPRSEGDFVCGLPGSTPPAMWLDVPLSRGGEEKSDTSVVNRSEARAIAIRLNEWMLCEAAQKESLTFAVICMYKAQAQEVQKYLAETGIMEAVKGGNEVKYSCTSKTKGLLEVGTVDAFQGKEFDVVFLSLVRSNKWNNVGFLKSPNRLCVAMSRQKKMLAVAGNSQMYGSEQVKKDVPSLYDFYALCKKRGAVING